VNEEMPFYVRDAVLEAVARQPICLSNAKVLLLGVSFKPNVDDTRHSPALRLIELLSESGIANLEYSDPYVSSVEVETPHGPWRRDSVELTDEKIRDADVVVIVTNHDVFPYHKIADLATVVIDTRNAMRNVSGDRGNIRLLGGGAERPGPNKNAC